MTCKRDPIGDAMLHACGMLGSDGVHNATGKLVSAFHKQSSPNNSTNISVHDLCALAGACEAAGHEHLVLTAIRQEIGKHALAMTPESVNTDHLLNGVLTGVKEAAEVADAYRASVDPNGPGGTRMTDSESVRMLAVVGEVIQAYRNLERDLLAARGGPREVGGGEGVFAYIRKEIFGLSQIDFAKALTINQSTISRWEAGELKPSHDDMRAIRELATQRDIKWDDKIFWSAPNTGEAAA